MVKETLAVSLQIKACLMMEGNAFRFNFFYQFSPQNTDFFLNGEKRPHDSQNLLLVKKVRTKIIRK